ncbi:hypothetical protein ACFWU3_29665 [Streptomyces sp. NPDC058685]|uniref:hypothetical protein n=1 Tax=Streptomyces sp. NPDC058685 TaxID=3346598 RepID=UPI00364C22C2
MSLALRVLDTYDGEQADQVHKAAVALSGGSLHRLASWMDGVRPPLDNFFWIAGGEQPDATEDQIFAARFLNAYYGKTVLSRQTKWADSSW